MLPKPKGVPESIRNHPKLNQAAKFLWVYVWELADFRPNTVITTPARLAADVGISERSVIRQLKELLEAALIEQVGKPRRGEWVYYIHSPKDWEIRFMVEMEHMGIGKSAPEMPIQNQETGNDAPALPIHAERENISVEPPGPEGAESLALKRLIQRKQSEMPRKQFSEYDLGTGIANCERSRSYTPQETVNSLQSENPVPADSFSEKSAQDLRPRSNSPGVMTATVRDALVSMGRNSGDREDYNEVWDWLRGEYPDENQVYGQLLRKVATAVVTGKLDKAKLAKMVEDSKQPRINSPEIYFCKTIKKILPGSFE